MASKIEVDGLAGAGSAGVMTVVGEGGSTTTSLQQGLAKAWFNSNGTSTAAIVNSFNISGITDNGTGDLTHAFTNDFENYNVAVGLGMNAYSPSVTSTAVGNIRTMSANSSGSATDVTFHSANLNGDLA